MAKLIRIAAALIDDADGHVLLVRKRGTICFMQPGGKIEAAESPFAALTRELAEELSFTPNERKAPFLGTFSCAAANEPGHMLEAHLFHVRANDREFAIGAELDEAMWIGIKAAPQLRLAPFTRDHVLPLARAISG